MIIWRKKNVLKNKLGKKSPITNISENFWKKTKTKS